MSGRKPIPKKLISFGANLLIWMSSVFVILFHRLDKEGVGFIQPLSQSDRNAIGNLVDPGSFVAFFVGIFIVYSVISYIGRKIGTKKAEEGIRAILDQIEIEAGSLFLNMGSLLVSVSFIANYGKFALFGFICWAVWFFIDRVKPRSSSEQSAPDQSPSS